MSEPTNRPRRRWLRRATIGVVVLVIVPLALFALNGLVLADGNTPRVRELAGVAPPAARGNGEVTVVSYNIAKAFVHRGGVKFESRERVEGRLRKMAAAIRAENPDLVFLSEAITECGPCNVDQAEFLAREVGLPHVATGENYNVGVPFYRVAGGNAILSRVPLSPVANFDLVGRRPFWVTKNNRRALVASAEFGGQSVLLVALHNDSYSIRNNESQVRQILEWLGDRPAMLAGDFNAKPDQVPMKLLRESGRFAGEWDGPPTYFDGDRKERIDYVLAPAAWELIEAKVIADDTSDHRPLVSRFRVKG
jgi:endonuclease/exonuclease/phosphatase family metal-dependent hydrolase